MPFVVADGPAQSRAGDIGNNSARECGQKRYGEIERTVGAVNSCQSASTGMRDCREHGARPRWSTSLARRLVEPPPRWLPCAPTYQEPLVAPAACPEEPDEDAALAAPDRVDRDSHFSFCAFTKSR
jgi:hypothetical protein